MLFPRLLLGLVAQAQAALPIIGILCQPFEDGHSSFLPASYVKWVEAVGARAIPLLYDWPTETLDEVLAQLNGVLFPGGSVDITPTGSAFGQASFRVFRYAVEQGVPLWGTCLGFEQIILYTYLYDAGLSAAPTPIKRAEAESALLSLDPLPDSEGSTLWRQLLSAGTRSTLTSAKVTVHLHHFGVLLEDWASATAPWARSLQGRLRILASANTTDTNRPFVSLLEGKGWRVWGSQFHPEKNAFEYNAQYDNGSFALDGVHHSAEAIDAMTDLARAFVLQARRSRADQGMIHMSADLYEKKLAFYNFIPTKCTALPAVKHCPWNNIYLFPRGTMVASSDEGSNWTSSRLDGPAGSIPSAIVI